jgi:hypothetical protein
MKPPNFLIIGETKAGTSSLHAYLRQHPQVYMPSLKETRFFAFDNANPQHLENVPRIWPITTWEDYLKLFEGVTHERAIGEASPNYFGSRNAVIRIHEHLPHAKLIVSLRNPADRLYSEYCMACRDGTEKRPFIQAFREDKTKWWIISSFPYENLKRYYELFSKSQLKWILFDDLKTDRAAVVRELFEFLQVDTSFTPDVSGIHNKGGIPSNKFLHRAYQALRHNQRIMRILKTCLPKSLAASAKTLEQRNLKKVQPLDPAVRNEIIDYYREDIEKLQDLLGRDLSPWLI